MCSLGVPHAVATRRDLKLEVAWLECGGHLRAHFRHQLKVVVLEEGGERVEHLHVCHVLPNAVSLSLRVHHVVLGNRVVVFVAWLPSLRNEFVAVLECDAANVRTHVEHHAALWDVGARQNCVFLGHAMQPDTRHRPLAGALLDAEVEELVSAQWQASGRAAGRVDGVEFGEGLAVRFWAAAELDEAPADGVGCSVESSEEEEDEISDAMLL
mmetsp:Transcript_28082/g.56918  ORF Transcript_28082/g.56918 Transcript_28082/m.56918 type:complete len:212 (+) Transcript_28082:223-858(+)